MHETASANYQTQCRPRAAAERGLPAFGRTRSEVVREALRRHLAQLRFEQLCRRVMPFAQARGYLTDEDVFDKVS